MGNCYGVEKADKLNDLPEKPVRSKKQSEHCPEKENGVKKESDEYIGQLKVPNFLLSSDYNSVPLGTVPRSSVAYCDEGEQADCYNNVLPSGRLPRSDVNSQTLGTVPRNCDRLSYCGGVRDSQLTRPARRGRFWPRSPC